MADFESPYASPETERDPPHKPDADDSREMSFWLAVAWSLLVLATMIVVQVIAVVPFAVARMAGKHPSELERVATELEHDGTVLAIATCLSTLVCVAAVSLIIRLSGWNVREYLRVQWPQKTSQVVFEFLTVIGFLVVSDVLTLFLKRNVVPDFMVKVYESGSLPLLAFAVIVAAPIGEEIIFRGFIIRNFTSSLGPVFAIVISSAVWAIIHMQYDWYGIATVFVGGLLLGTIYHRTKSLLLCILIHAFWNLVATAEVVIYVNYFQ